MVEKCPGAATSCPTMGTARQSQSFWWFTILAGGLPGSINPLLTLQLIRLKPHNEQEPIMKMCLIICGTKEQAVLDCSLLNRLMPKPSEPAVAYWAVVR